MNHARQERTLPQERIMWPLVVIGAGGIGSPAVLEMAKLGFEDIMLIDPDTVEGANIPTQLLWGPGDEEKLKVDVARERVLQLTGTQIGTFACSFPDMGLNLEGLVQPEQIAPNGHAIWGQVKWNPQAPLYIVISGLDSMKARQVAWEEVIKRNLNVPLYVEGRTGVGEAGQWLEIHTVRPHMPNDIACYEKWLYSDEEADETLACNSFLPVNTAIASIIASQVSKWIMGEKYFQRIALDLATLTLVRQEERQTTEKEEEKKGETT